MGCQPDGTLENTTPIAPTVTISVADNAPSATPTSVATPEPTQLATRISTETSTPNPTQTPTATPIPTLPPSATPSTWLIPDLSSSFFFAGKYEIYLLRLGQTPQFISPGQLLNEGQPWSPDGTEFIFNTQQSPSEPIQLAIADLRSGEFSYLNLLRQTSSAYWSPDGKSILYGLSGENGGILLILYHVETQVNEIITQVNRDLDTPFFLVGWSPDSRKIAFVSQINGQFDLYTFDVESLAQIQLTNSPDVEVIASWSPIHNQLLFGTTTDRVVFDGHPNQVANLQLVDESGENLRLLGEFEKLRTAAWSSDGNKIAYSDDGTLCILQLTSNSTVCPLEGSTFANEYRIAFYSPATWSADDNWLAFYAYLKAGNPCSRLYTLNLNTNELTQVDTGSCLRGPVYWFPILP
jgi:Tol biopolymer transport system component